MAQYCHKSWPQPCTLQKNFFKKTGRLKRDLADWQICETANMIGISNGADPRQEFK